MKDVGLLAASTPLVAVALLAGSIWVGSLVCLVVVTRVARHVLDRPAQVELFRGVGRRYGTLGPASLLVAIGAGLALSWPPSSWSGALDGAFALAVALVLLTIAGMAQARAMTAIRRRVASGSPDGGDATALRRGRLLAGALRTLMAAVTLAVVVLAAQAISS